MILITKLKQLSILTVLLLMTKEYPYNEKPIKVPRFHESGGFYTTRLRSKTMSKIRSKNTKPELLLRKALWANNIRFRTHEKKLPGKPDIVIRKYKLAIFIDGEFWHGKDWEKKRDQIKSNRAFWIPKIERNIQNDQITNNRLQELGYTVFRFWAEEVKKNLNACVNQVLLYIEAEREIRIPSNNP